MGWPRSIVGALQRLNQRGLAERGDLFLSISREYTLQRSVPGERHGYILRSFGANAYRSEAQERKSSIPVEIPVPYQLHKLSEGPPQHTQTTQDELMKYYRDMALIRRMEITADILFKSQQIRGFCHLYDGQEAVAVGLVEALTDDDSIITAYRDHGLYLARGGTLFECFSELMGKRTGCSGGKGGSMHLYNVKKRFYGGWGIVGTSAPLGAGLSFAHKYLNKKSVAVAIYGDGAANQGQIYEAKNLAALWDLPLILLVENNHFGMGTAEWRASKQITFYDRVHYIPGLKIDGMDVFAVREAICYAKEHCMSGKGPIVVECDTYRYHGHSMSDPGSTYRTHDEIKGIRQERDPINHVRKLILKEGFATADDLKSMDKEIRKEVEEAAAKAKEAPQPAKDALFAHIYKNDAALQFHGFVR